MLDICEVEINLCDYYGTMIQMDVLSLVDMHCEEVSKITEKNVEYIRLGFEFCENGLYHTELNCLIEKILLLNRNGFKVVFVLPPLHQRYIKMYRSCIIQILADTFIEEFVVNDIGTLCLLRDEIGWQGKITFGRLFDKSIREARMNLLELDNFDKHEQTVFLPSAMNDFQKRLAREYHIKSFETDTLTDGMLNVDQWTENYQVHLHFPRILLSKAAYCEYGQNDCTFNMVCSGKCKYYGKTIGRENKRTIYKEGLAIYGIQTKPLSEVVNGKIRLIYSGGHKV